jgi:hypothetical protein
MYVMLDPNFVPGLLETMSDWLQGRVNAVE